MEKSLSIGKNRSAEGFDQFWFYGHKANGIPGTKIGPEPDNTNKIAIELEIAS